MKNIQEKNLAISFVGHSNSGKTTLLEKIIADLSERGFRVGSVKHHGHFGVEVDKEGKDSWRHMRAGSVHTVISSPDKLVSIENRIEEQNIEHILGNMNSLDIIIVEGYRDSGIPYFELFREGNSCDSDELCLGGSEKRIALVTDRESLKKKAAEQGVDCFDLNDHGAISDRLEACINERRK